MDTLFDTNDFTTQKFNELRTVAKAAGLEVPRGTTKEGLIKLLEANNAPEDITPIETLTEAAVENNSDAVKADNIVSLKSLRVGNTFRFKNSKIVYEILRNELEDRGRFLIKSDNVERYTKTVEIDVIKID